ncbi:MAG: PVC-type heme-binding CxxCH protein [Planctomycetota bacterium]|nr:PVC-type heme-binding CxxCH protein [Planctomycetota bacterium]
MSGTASLAVILFAGGSTLGGESFEPPPLRVSEEFEITLAAAPPLVKHPMMACFDERGRLFIAETDGRNLKTEALLKERPRFIRMLEDTNGDGRFDKSTIFADNMVMPEGALWHRGALYVLSAPYLWRLEDTDDDGVADRREKLVGTFEVDGRPNQHGPYLGPCGRLYFSGGIFGYDLIGTDGSRTGKSTAGSVFSCRTDGSDVRVVGQGPLNPVEIAFSAAGEMFGTAAIFDNFGGRHDALIHWVPGAITRKQYGGPLLVKDSGQRLPALSRWGQVAPAGLARCRRAAFGEEYRSNLFACQFNTHKVVRVQLTREGSTFRSRDSDFLTSDSNDFHPTDVIEDADGSLLIVDTGGWLYFGCPTSKLAKPNVLGAIYRVKRKNAKGADDPRGLSLDWSGIKAGPLVSRLDDNRPAVRDRALQALCQRGADAVPELGKALAASPSPRLRRNIVWTLSDIATKSAKSLIRGALNDRDTTVQQAAIRSARVLRDAAAVKPLLQILRGDEAALRRVAATALGAIGDRQAVPSLLESLARDDNDEFLTHGLVYALLEIGDLESTRRGLASTDPQVQRGALIALQQLDGGKQLTWEMVFPLLESKDYQLRATAAEVIGSRKEWDERMAAQLEKWFAAASLDDEDASIASAVLATFADSPAVQTTISAALTGDTTAAIKQLAVRAIMASNLQQMPPALVDAIRVVLLGRDKNAVRMAVAAVFAKDTDRLDNHLLRLSRDETRGPSLRLMALAVAARHGAKIGQNDMDLLLTLWRDAALPIDRQRVAQVLGGATLEQPQVLQVAGLLAEAGPLELPPLLARFNRDSSPRVVNIDVQPGGGRVHRGLAAYATDPRGSDAAWNIWNPLTGEGLTMLRASDSTYAGASFSKISGATLMPWAGSQFDHLMGDFVYNGLPDGGGKHQEFENTFTIRGLTQQQRYGLYFYASAYPKEEPRGARVTIQHRGGKAAGSTTGLTLEDGKYRGSVSHLTFRDLQPREDGTFAVTWTAGDKDTKGNYGVFNGLTLVSSPSTFGRSKQLGLHIVDALGRSPGRGSIAPQQLAGLLSGFPAEVQQKAQSLIATALAAQKRRAARLEELLPKLAGGHAERGRSVFFGRRGVCSTCHRAEARGGDIGPDLSRIGRIRTIRDLAESILFPSVTVANGYEMFSIVTRSGRVYSGVVHRETPTAVFLRQADTQEVRIERSQIDEMERQEKSIMPDGFDRNLTTQQIGDLIAYLKSLK